MLLDVDPEPAVHRTVITFAAPPGVVEEAAINLVRTATNLIDMTKHRGVHPRIGAVDVLPFVPYLRCLDDRLRRPGPPGRKADRGDRNTRFLYGAAASIEQNVSLAKVRRGGYEGFQAAPTVPTSARPHSTAEAAPLPSAPASADRITSISTVPIAPRPSRGAAHLWSHRAAGGRDTRLPHPGDGMGSRTSRRRPGVVQPGRLAHDATARGVRCLYRMAEARGSTCAAARSSGWSRLGPCSAPATMRSALEGDHRW